MSSYYRNSLPAYQEANRSVFNELDYLRNSFEEERILQRRKILGLTDEVRSLKRLNKPTRNDKSSSTTIFKSIWWILCFAFFLLQSYFMTNQYLKREMNIETIYKTEEVIIPPAITICVSNAYRKPCKGKECYPYLTTNRNLFKNSLTFMEIFPVVVLIAPNGTQYILSTKTGLRKFRDVAITRYSLDQGICYHINSSSYFWPDMYKLVDAKKPGFSIAIALVMKDLSLLPKDIESWVIVNRPDEFYYRISNPLVSFQYGVAKLITYTRREIKLLKSPFNSNCRDYKGEGLVTQNWCQSECMLKEVLAKKLPIPMHLPYFKADDNPRQINDQTDANIDLTVNLGDCMNTCSQLECNIIEYSSLVIGQTKEPNNITSLGMTLSSEAELLVNYREKMGIAEYLAFIGSFLGTWLGVSAFNLYDGFLALFGIIKSGNSEGRNARSNRSGLERDRQSKNSRRSFRDRYSRRHHNDGIYTP